MARNPRTKLRRNFELARMQFLGSELRVAFTFASMASKVRANSVARVRYESVAWQAYNAVSHFAADVDWSSPEYKELGDKKQRIEAKLNSLDSSRLLRSGSREVQQEPRDFGGLKAAQAFARALTTASQQLRTTASRLRNETAELRKRAKQLGDDSARLRSIRSTTEQGTELKPEGLAPATVPRKLLIESAN